MLDLPFTPGTLYECEEIAREAGYHKIIGIDEAGRGPLAGPVSVASLYIPPGKELPGINDSKQLTEKQRKSLYELITNDPELEWSVIDIDATVIDDINILQATYKGMRQVAKDIKDVDLIFVDGNAVPDLPYESINLVKGDGRAACIAAASIIAKEHRDQLMIKYDQEYPEYGFASHKGYGTKKHLEALEEFGPCDIHRKSFAPVQKALNKGLQGDLGLF